jgi:hypothetical protein
MQVAQPFEIDVISVKETWVQNTRAAVAGSDEIPAYVIFGSFSTKRKYAYDLEKVSDIKSHFEAVMGIHPVEGRFFVRIGLLGDDWSNLFQGIIASHLKQLNLTGTCDTLLPVSETGEKNI